MTELTDLQQKISDFLPEIRKAFMEPMAKHTSLRIGGGAEVMLFPSCETELSMILKTSALLDRKPVILGAGTNVLAPDEGIPGIVICLKDGLNSMERVDNLHIRIAAGVTMARAAVFAANCGLSGMEFAHGIPGTVGGGVYMNAGAYGGEIGMICCSVRTMGLDGNIREYTREQMKFSYRDSILQSKEEIVLSATFVLQPGNPEEIQEIMRQLQKKRSVSQPLNYPSAGSAFKRPAGGYAAALIQEAGLKGFRVGGAAISEKHSGFAINLENATAADFRELLRQVSERVFEQTGIWLEPEIRIW